VAKLASKSAAVYALARLYAPAHAWPVALLMSTGLTVGTISTQAVLSLGVITKAQFSVLVCAVALSAVVPTAIAQRILTSHPVLETELEVGPVEPAADVEEDDEVPVHRREHPARDAQQPAAQGPDA